MKKTDLKTETVDAKKNKRKVLLLAIIPIALILTGAGYYIYSSGILTHNHTYDSRVISKEATCTEEGITTFTCECGETYTETIPAIGHDWENIISVVHHDAYTETIEHESEYDIVHHEAEYKTVHIDAKTKHHDPEYTTVHHDAEYTIVHHDAEVEQKGEENVTIVHHDAEITQVWVVDKEAYDEVKLEDGAWDDFYGDLATFTVYDAVAQCHGCKAILITHEDVDHHFDLEYNHPEVIPMLNRMHEIDALYKENRDEGLKYRDEYIELSNEYTRIADEFYDLHHGYWGPLDYFYDTSGNIHRFTGSEYYEPYHEALRAHTVTVHHPEEGHYETKEISPAWDERIVINSEESVIKPAWDEQVLVKEAYDEHVLVKEAYDEVIPAHDENILVKDAYDEKVLIKDAWTETIEVPAWDESIVSGLKCKNCGETQR